MKKKFKTILWVVATMMVCFAYCCLVTLILTIGTIIKGIITHSTNAQMNEEMLSGATIFGIIVLIVMSVILYRKWKRKCMACKRWDAMFLFNTDLLAEQDIHVPIESAHRNISGEYVGSHEQYVPGKRKTYCNTYQCRYCGYETTENYNVDEAMI